MACLLDEHGTTFRIIGDTSDSWTTAEAEVVFEDDDDEAAKVEEPEEEADDTHHGSPKPEWAPAVIHQERPRQVASGYG